VQVEAVPEGMEVEELVLLAIEGGAEDFTEEDGILTFYTAPTQLAQVRDALRGAGVEVSRAQLAWVPKSTVKVEGREAERLLKLLDELDDHEDVQEVVANFEIPDEVFARVEG